MAVDNFIYQGINRAVSDYTGARACEELINLRPTEGGLVPVKDFTAKFSNKSWDRVFVHYTTSGPKYIVVKRSSSAVNVYYLTNASDPTSLVSLFDVTGLTQTGDVQDVIDHLYFAAAGNVILFSINAATAGKYENHAFTWKLDESSNTLKYVEMEANVPPVEFDVEDTEQGATSDIYIATQSIARIDKNSSVSECSEAVQAGLNAIMEENPDVCYGPILIAIAYKTTDGQTFWTGDWRVYDPFSTIKNDSDTTYVVETSSYYSSFFNKYGYGYFTESSPEMAAGSAFLNNINVAGTKVRLEFDQLTAGAWNKDTSIIQSLEVYASKPICYLDPDGAKDGLFELTGGLGNNRAYYHLYLPGIEAKDMDLGSQILYLQASIEMASLAEAPQTVKLSFGGNIQMTEDTLDVDAGALKRYGQVLSYNARFHYFDSVAKIEVGMPYFAWDGSGSAGTPYVLVRYADDDQSGLMYLGTTSGYIDIADVVIAPSLNIKEVITCAYDGSYVNVTSYRMTPSTAYNFSINTGGGVNNRLSNVQFQATEYYTLIQGGANSVLDNVETDAINVTEQYNPFVFKVEHSYKAPGNIIDVQPQMAGVVDASYGRDPLNVFTERGLYALTQGSANVLYGAFLPLSNLKASKGGIPVESGTFFLADGNLWLVSGRKVTLISEALTLGPHKYIRSCNGYKKLSGTDANYSPSPAPANPIYDVSSYLSQVEFKTFVNGDATSGISAGQLSYNRYRMELFVSNKSYDYSYVLSLKNYQWYKISKRLWQDEPGSTIVNIPGSATGTISILDMSQEVSQSETPLLIHMQSRPFSMGYQYAHVHRIVTMMRAKLENAGQKVAVGLYGSDDLQHWNLLSYGKWAGKTEENPTTHATTDNPLYLSQLRTPSSARSWRYYTVCIGGYIPVAPDFPTDIGPVLVDYKPVVRRLG